MLCLGERLLCSPRGVIIGVVSARAGARSQKSRFQVPGGQGEFRSQNTGARMKSTCFPPSAFCQLLFDPLKGSVGILPDNLIPPTLRVGRERGDCRGSSGQSGSASLLTIKDLVFSGPQNKLPFESGKARSNLRRRPSIDELWTME